MPKDYMSGFRDQTNQERRDEARNRNYKDFNNSSSDAEEKHFRGAVKEWTSAMNDDEQSGVTTYTGSTYEKMNRYLREDKMGSGQDAYMEGLINRAASGVSKFKLKDNLTVYRKSGDSIFSEIGVKLGSSPSEFVKEINSFRNTVIRDKGFTSTSTRDSKWSGKVHFEIQVPHGTNCAYVASISHFSSENELLLNHGTRFKILGASLKGDVPVVRLLVVKK